MLRLKSKKAFFLLLFFQMATFYFLIACSETTAPPPVDSFLKIPSPAPEEQTSVTATPTPKISPGQSLRFENLSLEQGLSQSTVFSILQDNQGFMWFGTEDGLNKYDGYNFTIYKNDPEDPNSLSGNWVGKILEDDLGLLWIGTSDRGLSRYDRDLDQFTYFRHDPEDPTSLSNDEISSIYQDKDGVLWIGTSNGINKFDQENERFTRLQHNPRDINSLSSNKITVIYEDKEGMLWTGTEDSGLNKYDRKNEHWSHYLNDPNDHHSLIHNNVSTVTEDQAGALWIGTNGGGLDRFDKVNDRFIHYQYDPNDPNSISSDEITTIYPDRKGNLWVGTLTGALDRYDPELDIFIHFQDALGDSHNEGSHMVLSIHQDREGVLWVGTLGGGAFKLNLGWRNFPHFQNNPNDSNSMSDNMVRSFHKEQKNALWVGTMFGGLDRFDRTTGEWRQYRHEPDNPESLSNNLVSSIYKDQSNNLWVGTASGLDYFHPEANIFTHYQANINGTVGTLENNVRAIYEISKENYLIGTRAGLYQFDLEENRWSQFDIKGSDEFHNLNSAWISSFLEDHNGRLWITTYLDGLYVFDLKTFDVSHYHNDPDDPASLSSNLINSGLLDSNGDLWFGSTGGLNRFDPVAESFSHYREKDGLPNDTIYCIKEDDQGFFWLSTNKGLSKFDPQNETFQNYDVSDGLQSNEFNGGACYQSESGEMFFGGIDGFNAFFPDQINQNLTVPSIVLTSLIVSDEQVNLGSSSNRMQEYNFEWPDNSFEFEYAALSFADPDKNQYAYYLEGFEDTWNEVGTRRYGQYTNLPGGTYTLHVIGSNNDGVWNETGDSVKITVVPPFWETWWFRSLLGIATLGLIYGGYRLRVANIESRSKDLEQLVEARTAELNIEIDQRMKIEEALRASEMEKAISEERNRLARDLHDSVTQSIYSLTLLSEAGQRMVRSGDFSQVEENQSRLGEISQQALQEMRLLVYELRPQILENEGLIGALEQRLAAVERRAGINAHLHGPKEIDLPHSLEQELFHITTEALNNILKHSGASEVNLSMKVEEDMLVLKVADNGHGFDPSLAKSQGGIGITSMHERTEKIGGNITIESVQGEGTVICVSVPIPWDNTTKDVHEEEN